MEETQYARKLDGAGRLVVPSKLREEMNLAIGDVYKFFYHREGDKRYLCIECPKGETDLEKALRILKENGMTAIKNEPTENDSVEMTED